MNEIEGVLSRFSLKGVWNAKATDEQITVEVNEKHGSAEDAGEWRTDLFPSSTCKKFNPHRQWMTTGHKLRTYHYKHTLPWERGVQVVTAAFQEQYDSMICMLWAECKEAGEEFFAWYPTGIEKAKRAHNGSFNPKLYPDVGMLRSKFTMDLGYEPIPQGHHFVKSLAGQAVERAEADARAAISQAHASASSAIERARAEFEARNQRLLKEAVAHAWNEVLTPVMGLAERLATPDMLVREDVVQGIRDMLERVPALNLTNDPNLRQAADQIRQTLLGVTAAGLRDHPVQRMEVAKQSIALLKRFGNMGSRKFA